MVVKISLLMSEEPSHNWLSILPTSTFAPSTRLFVSVVGHQRAGGRHGCRRGQGPCPHALLVWDIHNML